MSILLDPDDDVAVTRTLLGCHDPAGDAFVVHPTATSRRPREVAHDVLAALGAPAAALFPEHLGWATTAWSAVRAWLSAFRIEYLVILRAHRFDADTWTHLIDLTRGTEVSLVLVCHTGAVPARLAATVHGVAHQVIDFATLPQVLDAHPGLRPRRARPARPRRYGELPSDLPTRYTDTV